MHVTNLEVFDVVGIPKKCRLFICVGVRKKREGGGVKTGENPP